MRQLSAKFMNTNIKKGWTIENFAGYFGISEEEFLKKMRKTFNKRGVEEMISEMKKNRKKVNGKKTVETAEPVVEPATEPVVEPATESVGDTVDANVNLAITDDTVNAKVSQGNKTIHELKAKESELSEKLCIEENHHKELVSNRHNLYDSLRKHRSKLVRLQSELQDCMYSVIEIDENISKINEEMEKSNSNKKEIKNQLEKVRAEIETCSKINILAYEDGTIEIDEEVEIPAEWSSFATELTSNEAFESLTVRQIKQLAKLVVLTFDLEKRGVKYDLVFDSEIVQQLFEQLK